ncbi:MAG: TonB-dependent receptor plug domain-containing protein [Elusimicrobiota bacterium]
MNRVLPLALLLLAAPASADDEAFEFFKEEAQVVTASRRPEPALRAPAVVDVVTAEDIKAYGFRNIWDALRYRVGVNAIDGTSIDGNRALVAVRGNSQEFVDELLVLLDGRAVYSPILGGVYWASLPVQMEDIDRIEIARGPNAVLYGSNAATGVINIITKKPAPKTEAAIGAWGGTQDSFGTSAAGVVAGAAGGVRLSHEYRSEGNDPASNGVGYSNDFMHTDKLNARAEWKPDAATSLEFLGGGSWLGSGIPGLPNSPTAHNTENFQSLHGTRDLGTAAQIEASLSRSETTINPIPLPTGPVYSRTYQYDAEALHHMSWLDGLAKACSGVSWRFSGADSDQVFAGSPRQSNEIWRAYTHHSVRAAEPLTLVAGAALEHSSTGGPQPAWQAAALYEPAPEQILRFSYSRAPTIPLLFSKHADYLLSPAQQFSGNLAIEPEQITSWEAGWNGRFLDGALRPTVAVYFMNIDDQYFNFVASSGIPNTIIPDNRQASHARGAELSAAYALSRGRAVFANYTFEKISNDKGPDAVGEDSSRSTPVHMINVGGRALIARGVTAAAVLGYKDNYRIASSRGTVLDAPRSFRLDARVGWTPYPGWEVFVAGSNLLQPYTVEYADGVGNPRFVRGGFTARFGR